MNTDWDEQPKAAVRIAHAVPALCVVMIVVRALNYTGRAPGIVDLVCTVVMVVAYLLLVVHVASARLCLKCMRNAPLDPGGEVRQWNLLLRQYHLPFKTNVRIILATLALTWIGAWIGGWVATASRVPLDAFWLAGIYGFWVHHRLTPWCPYCRRWDDDGDPELVPDPDPAEGKRIV